MTDDRLASNNAYYDRFADRVGDRSDKRDYSRAIELFRALLQSGDTVLDIGCGSGHHMALFREMGYRAIGIDPSEKMRELASSKGLEVVEGALETLRSINLPPIHGVWCAATLLHVPEAELAPALSALRERVPEGGPLFVTVREGQGATWDAWDDPEGDAKRLIQLYSEDQLRVVLWRSSFLVSESWSEASYWGRPAVWLSILAVAI